MSSRLGRKAEWLQNSKVKQSFTIKLYFSTSRCIITMDREEWINLSNEPRFHFSYMHERGDQIALTTAITRQSPLTTLRVFFIIISIALIIAYFAAGLPLAEFLRKLTALPLRVFIPIFIAVGLVFCLPLIRMALVALWFKPADRVVVTLDIDENGIASTRGQGLQGRADWAAVTGIIETRNHCFFPIARNAAFILPRRAGSLQQYEQAVAFAKSRLGLPAVFS